MIQIISRVVNGVGFGAGTQFRAFADGQGVMTFTAARHPIPIDGLIRKLTIRNCGNLPGPITLTCRHEGADTLLATTLTTADDQVFDDVHSVAILAGERSGTKLAGLSSFFPGYDLAYSYEWEGAGMVFGIAAISDTMPAGTSRIGGALGNGTWMTWGGAGESLTYSICPLTGAVTTLMLARYLSPSGGSFRGWIRLNGVTQDGTGGTVDTTCLLLDSGPATASSTFSLPVVPTDHVDVLVTRFTTTSGGATEVIGAGICVVPSDGTSFALCGGSNDVIPPVGTAWKWNSSVQEGATISLHEAPVGRTPITLTGYYIEHGPPGAGDAYVHQVLKNGLGTALNLTIGDTGIAGQITGTVDCLPGDRWTNEIVNTNSPVSTLFHWGVAGHLTVPPEPPAENDCPEQVSAGCWSPHSANRLTVELDGDYDL